MFRFASSLSCQSIGDEPFAAPLIATATFIHASREWDWRSGRFRESDSGFHRTVAEVA